MTSVDSVSAWMADSAEEVWLRDELVLVLDLYIRQGKRPALEVRQALEDALRSFRWRPEPPAGGRWVLERKLLEFAGLDPEDPTPDGLAAAAPERAIWDEFANDRAHLRSEANAVRTRVYDVVAFLQARTEPMEDPGSNASFRVVECTRESVTYRRGRASDKTGTVATAALQEILGEVLDRAYGGGRESFEVSVDPRFWIDHGRFADAVVAAITGRHVFGDGMYNGVAGEVGSSLGSDTASEPGPHERARGLKNDAGRPRPAEVGLAYVSADESGAVAEREPFATDPDVVERGTRSHARLQNQLAADVASSGLVPLSPAAGDPPFDLAWRDGADLHVAEVKSTTAMNEKHQLRLGLGQLLYYRHALSAGSTTVHATLYVERQPTDPAWSELCQSLGVTVRWPPR
jgi:hypothetical protein